MTSKVRKFLGRTQSPNQQENFKSESLLNRLFSNRTTQHLVLNGGQQWYLFLHQGWGTGVDHGGVKRSPASYWLWEEARSSYFPNKNDQNSQIITHCDLQNYQRQANTHWTTNQSAGILKHRNYILPRIVKELRKINTMKLFTQKNLRKHTSRYPNWLLGYNGAAL